jgi:predicted choloylglycine hydrolase
VGDPDLRNLPEWVKSLGLPPEAADAIDRWWKPIWEEIELLPEHPRRGEELEFEAVVELEPGAAWQARFQAMLPELLPTYERLVGLAGDDELAARVLTLYRPPGFVVGCSQGAWTRDAPVLVRNYDYPVARLEGVVCLTAWTDRRVIGMSDCLWGLLDGMNDAGLAVSLTFGGRRDVGDGFAIPLVVRYLLETCDTVSEARDALARIPVHAPQNLTLLDASGEYITAYVGPGRAAEFHAVAATTNHQGRIDWPEYARAIRSEERERCVLDLLADTELDRERFVAAFLEPPLRNTDYARGFGTVYTAAYFPAEGRMEYRWPGTVWEQSFDGFREGSHTETFAAEPRAA